MSRSFLYIQFKNKQKNTFHHIPLLIIPCLPLTKQKKAKRKNNQKILRSFTLRNFQLNLMKTKIKWNFFHTNLTTKKMKKKIKKTKILLIKIKNKIWMNFKQKINKKKNNKNILNKKRHNMNKCFFIFRSRQMCFIWIKIFFHYIPPVHSIHISVSHRRAKNQLMYKLSKLNHLIMLLPPRMLKNNHSCAKCLFIQENNQYLNNHLIK